MRMHRLVWAFAGHTYHIVGNLMPWLKQLSWEVLWRFSVHRVVSIFVLKDKFALLGQQSTYSSAGKYCDCSMFIVLCQQLLLMTKFALLGKQSTNSSAGKYCDCPRFIMLCQQLLLMTKFALLGQQSTNSSAGKYCDRSMSIVLCHNCL